MRKTKNDKKFQLYNNKKDEVVLEICKDNKEWRKDYGHNETYESALTVARIA